MIVSPQHRIALERLSGHIRILHPRFRKATVYSVLNKLFDIAPEVLIGVAVDLVVQQEDSLLAQLGFETPIAQLAAIGTLTLLIWCCESLFQFLHQVEWRNLSQTIQHMLRMDAYEHVQDLDMSWYENSSTGNLLSILNDDINQIERFLNAGANEVIQVVVSTLVVGAIFFFISPSITLIAFCPIPVILFGVLYFQKRLGPLYLAVRTKAGALATRLDNNISGIATIKSFTAEEFELRQLEHESLEYQAANQSAIRLSSAFIPVIRMAILSGFVVTLVWGGWMALQGTLAVGSYSVLIFLTQRLLWPLTKLGQTIDDFERAMAATYRVMDVIETERGITDPESPQPLPPVAGKLDLQNITFAYPEKPALFSEMNLSIPAHSFVGFVGSTGSGKSTILKLILRFFDPQSGAVLLDDIDVRNVRLHDLRSQIGLVSQEVFLFQGTVRENIAYGNPDAATEDVVRAAQIAEADQFISALPDGYDTAIGERGQKLSGGQRQRISIARAVLKNPAILILDEATSAVDNETEAAIQRSLERIAADRTTIVVAHRLSTIRNADVIFVLEDGVVTSCGTHQGLLTESAYYRRLWSIQTGEVI